MAICIFSSLYRGTAYQCPRLGSLVFEAEARADEAASARACQTDSFPHLALLLPFVQFSVFF